MKIKILLLAVMFILSGVFAHAQTGPQRLTRVQSDTSVNADTSVISWVPMPSKLISMTSTVTRLSGSVAGKVYLQATDDNSDWVTLDSMVLTNQATNSKRFPLRSAAGTSYYGYRFYYISSGTQTSKQSGLALIRRDD